MYTHKYSYVLFEHDFMKSVCFRQIAWLLYFSDTYLHEKWFPVSVTQLERSLSSHCILNQVAFRMSFKFLRVALKN